MSTVTTPDVPADGPGAVLTRLATRLKLPYQSSQIALWLAAHPRPNSLLALVDVASQMGVDIKPAKAGAGALRDLALPAIVHFEAAGGGGFGVLEKADGDGFEVWDSSNGSRMLDDQTFTRYWSGIVGLIDLEGAQQEARGDLRGRIAAFMSGPSEPPSVSGGPGAWWLRGLLGIVLLTLLVIGVASHPTDERLWIAALAALCVAGVIVTSVMTIAISDYGGPFSPGMCRRRRFVDCHSVLTSRFAKIAGFPLSDVGISFYSAVLLTLAATAVIHDRAVAVLIATAFAATVPVAVVLIGVQIAMRRICTLCLTVHAINLAAAAIAASFAFDRAVTAFDVIPASLLLGLMFCLVLFFVVPYFKREHAWQRLSRTHARMASSPFASLAQLGTEQPTQLAGGEVGVALNDNVRGNELVAFVHPACNQCEPVLRELRSIATSRHLSVFVAVPTKDDGERELCEAIVATGLSADPEAFLRAYAIAKRRFKELTAADPWDVLAMELDLDRATFEAARPTARDLVTRSERFARDHVEGTPALFFASLPFRGPLAHLMTLLNEHADLLPAPRQREARL